MIGFIKRIPKFLKQVYRLFLAKKRSQIVWKELIKLHKEMGWQYGQYDKEKLIDTFLTLDEGSRLRFNFFISDENLIFISLILIEFDEDATNDIMALS